MGPLKLLECSICSEHGKTTALAPVDTQLHNTPHIVKKVNVSGNEADIHIHIQKECEFGFIPVQFPVVWSLPVWSGCIINANNMQEWVVQAHKDIEKEHLPNYL